MRPGGGAVLLVLAHYTPWFLRPAAGAGLPTVCAPRSSPPLQSHPRLGVTSAPADIGAGFARLAAGPRPAPARRSVCQGQLAVAWLVQVKRKSRLTSWHLGLDPLIVLEWGTSRPAPGLLHMPHSNIGEGRNLLTLTALEQELRQGWRWDYLIHVDEDVNVTAGSAEGFAAFLLRWQPAVGVPEYGCRGHKYQKHRGCTDFVRRGAPWATSHADHIWVAYRDDTADMLWPMDTSLDGSCFWSSQYMQTLWAASLYPGHVLVDGATRVGNPQHDFYPRKSCNKVWCRVTLQGLRRVMRHPSLGIRALECYRPHPFLCPHPAGGPIDLADSCIGELEGLLRRGAAARSADRTVADECGDHGAEHMCVSGAPAYGGNLSYASPVNAHARGPRCGGWPPWRWPWQRYFPRRCSGGAREVELELQMRRLKAREAETLYSHCGGNSKTNACVTWGRNPRSYSKPRLRRQRGPLR